MSQIAYPTNRIFLHYHWMWNEQSTPQHSACTPTSNVIPITFVWCFVSVFEREGRIWSVSDPVVGIVGRGEVICDITGSGLPGTANRLYERQQYCSSYITIYCWRYVHHNISFTRHFLAEFSMNFSCYAVYKTRRWSSLKSCACQLVSE